MRLVDAGNLVQATDATGLVVITQLDPIAVLFTLPQDELAAVAAGAGATASSRSRLYARDGTQKLGARASSRCIDNQINQQTATLRLKATCRTRSARCGRTQFVKARLLARDAHGRARRPAVAIQRGPQGTFVYVVGAGQDGAACSRSRSRSIEGDDAIVAKGLAGGEQVVVEGQSQLRPGGKVRRATAAKRQARATARGATRAAPRGATP